MAIGTDAAINFVGAQDSLDNTSGSVADDAFSVAGDLLDWTNDDDALTVDIVLEANFSVAPDANSSVALFAQVLNVVSTNDPLIPTANYQDVFLTSFPVKDVTGNRFSNPKTISLPRLQSSQIVDYFIQNNTGQTISAGWDLHVTPNAIGPHA